MNSFFNDLIDRNWVDRLTPHERQLFVAEQLADVGLKMTPRRIRGVLYAMLLIEWGL